MKLVMLTALVFVVAGGSSSANAQSAAKAAPAASIPTIGIKFIVSWIQKNVQRTRS